jgi:hypothetical protein
MLRFILGLSGIMFKGITVDCLVRTAMHPPIGLFVANQSELFGSNGTAHRV